MRTHRFPLSESLLENLIAYCHEDSKQDTPFSVRAPNEPDFITVLNPTCYTDCLHDFCLSEHVLRINMSRHGSGYDEAVYIQDIFAEGRPEIIEMVGLMGCAGIIILGRNLETKKFDLIATHASEYASLNTNHKHHPIYHLKKFIDACDRVHVYCGTSFLTGKQLNIFRAEYSAVKMQEVLSVKLGCWIRQEDIHNSKDLVFFPKLGLMCNGSLLEASKFLAAHRSELPALINYGEAGDLLLPHIQERPSFNITDFQAVSSLAPKILSAYLCSNVDALRRIRNYLHLKEIKDAQLEKAFFECVRCIRQMNANHGLLTPKGELITHDHFLDMENNAIELNYFKITFEAFLDKKNIAFTNLSQKKYSPRSLTIEDISMSMELISNLSRYIDVRENEYVFSNAVYLTMTSMFDFTGADFSEKTIQSTITKKLNTALINLFCDEFSKQTKESTEINGFLKSLLEDRNPFKSIAEKTLQSKGFFDHREINREVLAVLDRLQQQQDPCLHLSPPYNENMVTKILYRELIRKKAFTDTPDLLITPAHD